MKKIFSMFLVSLLLLTSCVTSVEDFKGNSSGTNNAMSVSSKLEEKMKITNGIVITTKYPHAYPAYKEYGLNTPTKIDYILQKKGGSYEEIELAMSYEANIIVSGVTYDYGSLTKQYWEHTPKFSGIADNKEKFKNLYESLTGENYSDRFSDEFFEDNIVFFMHSSPGFEVCFVGFEYGFDSETKKLKIAFETRPHEGWTDSLLEVVGSVMYIIPIAKSDLTVDGKLVTYEELNIEVTGNLTLE